MDLQAVTRGVRGAESIRIESPEHLGYTVGEIMKYFPEDIWAGQLALRKRTPEAKVIKAYVKFAQAWRELESALPPCTSLPADTIAAIPNSKQSGKIARSCTTLAALPLALTEAPIPKISASKPVASPKAKFSKILNSKAAQKMKSHGFRFVRWGLATGVALLLPGLTTRAAGIAIQIITALVAADIQSLAAAAAEESTRLGTQLVRMAEESLDICLIEPPLPLAAPADSQGVAAQILSALAGNTSAAGLAMSAADLASRLPVPSPPPSPPSVDKSLKFPGWLLLVFGFAVRAYT